MGQGATWQYYTPILPPSLPPNVCLLGPPSKPPISQAANPFSNLSVRYDIRCKSPMPAPGVALVEAQICSVSIQLFPGPARGLAASRARPPTRTRSRPCPRPAGQPASQRIKQHHGRPRDERWTTTASMADTWRVARRLRLVCPHSAQRRVVIGPLG